MLHNLRKMFCHYHIRLPEFLNQGHYVVGMQQKYRSSVRAFSIGVCLGAVFPPYRGCTDGNTVLANEFTCSVEPAVIAGPHDGNVGKLVSLFDITPEPVFHLEGSDGGDVLVRQSEIEALDSAARS